jgi:hypothetical protein
MHRNRGTSPKILEISPAGCQAPETPPEPDAPERRLLAERCVQEKLALWRRRLKLKDWTISVAMSHPADLRHRTLGNIYWNADKKTAVIRVLDASDCQMPFRATIKDMEFTVVHELIQLELASLPRSEASRSEEEYAINHLAARCCRSIPRTDRRTRELNRKPYHYQTFCA